MAQDLNGKKVAILVANGFEQVELTQPRHALDTAGAQTHIVSPESDRVQGWNHYDKADYFPVDVSLEQAKASNYDALLLPGGTVNPDQLRTNERAVAFVREFFEANKPVAAICHGPWTLAEAGVLKGRKLTSWPSLRTDMQNAGGLWVDQEVVTDGGLITSRNPDDIPAFNQTLIEAIAATRQAVSA
ncbi:MAG: type 1 glutamine amidotransferase [Leptolyngbyaceae cyanobacterium SM1_1_3]|nr:type 1 glutamine amidotransferase [Leptolyngbyaceae cyanobacterium SM1_1_3]NJN03665.1 type 1 glutamine amidotransferase [Leptolyngbyaceae cyanobacterium RM1_1_2]NJO09130.1 type 1 glutamine amidotransferase [Leptolyngbyaceae cyanobacterium SL_1_1]